MHCIRIYNASEYHNWIAFETQCVYRISFNLSCVIYLIYTPVFNGFPSFSVITGQVFEICTFNLQFFLWKRLSKHATIINASRYQPIEAQTGAEAAPLLHICLPNVNLAKGLAF